MKVIVSSTHSDVFSEPRSSRTSRSASMTGCRISISAVFGDRDCRCCGSAAGGREFVEEAARAASDERRSAAPRPPDASCRYREVRSGRGPFELFGKRRRNRRTALTAPDELLVRIDLEVLEIAAPIARRDPRFKQPARVLAFASSRSARRDGHQSPRQVSNRCRRRWGRASRMLNR